MTTRRLEALRALAERPGTEAEGILAREILDRLEGEQTHRAEEQYRRWLRRDISLDELLRAMKPQPLTPEELDALHFASRQAEEARLRVDHAAIQAEIRRRFKKGDRIFYNKWAYSKNEPGVVTGYVRPKAENGTHPWAWLSCRFDRHLWPRQIPVWSERGWHLSLEPLGDVEAERLRGA